MSSKGGESLAFCSIYSFHLCGMVLLVYLVSCKSNKGQLYLDKFDISKRHFDNFMVLIIHFLNLNLTVAESVKMETVHHALGKPLCDYSLTCLPEQGSTKQDNLSSSCIRTL